MDEQTTPEPTPEKPVRVRKRAITRVPRSYFTKRTTPRDRLAANGIEPRNPTKKRGRGRPKKVGRPRKYRDHPLRLSPSYRKGARWHTITVPEEGYYMLKELSLFYKKSMSQMMAEVVKPAFDKAYQESLTLERIAKNKEKANAQTQHDDQPARRTHF